MEGKLAKHSDFFPIIEFLHLKSLNSNSQQFHVLLGLEILTVQPTNPSDRLDDILLLYSPIITTLDIRYHSTDIVSSLAGSVLNCRKSST